MSSIDDEKRTRVTAVRADSLYSTKYSIGDYHGVAGVIEG